eukprot:UN25226
MKLNLHHKDSPLYKFSIFLHLILDAPLTHRFCNRVHSFFDDWMLNL